MAAKEQQQQIQMIKKDLERSLEQTKKVAVAAVEQNPLKTLVPARGRAKPKFLP